MQKGKDHQSKNKIVHAMTIDVEDYFHVAAMSKVVSMDKWDSIPSRVSDNTLKILNIFNQHNIHGTFFVLGWVAERYPDIVKEIVNQGHEIASHGYSHQLIYSQSIDTFREETHRSKSILEDIIQKPVTGYRAASYSITKKSLWALDVLAELGFTWDSSIFPIYHDNYGIPDTPSEPYTIHTNNGSKLIEFPITSCQKFGLSIPAAGGGYFRQFPYPLFKYLFKTASKKNKIPKVFYLHPWEVDPEQPRFNEASWLSRFRHYTNLDKCEGRLNRLIKDFNFGTLSESLDCVELSQNYKNLENTLVKLT